ncbi:MAG: sugar phosphate isomerase/epimerase [Ruminococcaceae bacterium]|nr:sugar phosphate isomerase/epimerase [Oscillospiraceae bacterium]
MKISTSTDYHFKLFGEKNALKVFKDAGFDALDYSLFTHNDYGPTAKGEICELYSRPKNEVLEYFSDIKRVADTVGIEIGQVHAPFPSYTSSNPEANANILKLLDLSVEITAALGSEYLIIHPACTKGRIYDIGVEECKAVNMELYGALIPTAKKCGVKICTENMWTVDPATNKKCATVCSHAHELADYVDTLNEMAGERIFYVCLDVGHTSLTDDDPAEALRILGDRTATLHIHDTDGIVDSHTLPYLGVVKWDSFFTAMRETGYKGNFNFEAANFFKNFGKEFINESSKFMCDLAKMVIKKYGL